MSLLDANLDHQERGSVTSFGSSTTTDSEKVSRCNPLLFSYLLDVVSACTKTLVFSSMYACEEGGGFEIVFLINVAPPPSPIRLIIKANFTILRVNVLTFDVP